jgi:hypothetical protein
MKKKKYTSMNFEIKAISGMYRSLWSSENTNNLMSGYFLLRAAPLPQL